MPAAEARRPPTPAPRGDRADLLRREHLPARAAAARARRDRPRARATLPFASEVLVLDNGSRDGSAEAARARTRRSTRRSRSSARRGKALNDSRAAARAPAGRYALLLNEDSELLPGRDARALAGAAGAPAGGLRGGAAAAPRRHARRRARGASRRPRPRSRARSFLHRLLTVQSRGERAREVDWCQSSALLVRREAAAAGRLPRPRLLRLLRRGRLRPAPARRRLAQPVRARRRAAVHHEQLSTDVGARAADRGAGAQPRPVHAQAPLRRRGARRALADRLDLRRARARRAGAARARRPRATGATSRRTLHPERGEGLREAAERYNAAAGA